MIILQNQTQNGINVAPGQIVKRLNVGLIEKNRNVGGCLAGLAGIRVGGKDTMLFVEEVPVDVGAASILCSREINFK